MLTKFVTIITNATWDALQTSHLGAGLKPGFKPKTINQKIYIHTRPNQRLPDPPSVVAPVFHLDTRKEKNAIVDYGDFDSILR